MLVVSPLMFDHSVSRIFRCSTNHEDFRMIRFFRTTYYVVNKELLFFNRYLISLQKQHIFFYKVL